MKHTAIGHRFLVALTISLILALSANAATPTLIVHPGVPEESLQDEDVQRIYLGKKSRWSDDTHIVPVMLKSGSLRSVFLRSVLERNETKYNTYWKQALFTGRGIPPKELDTLQELIDFVASTPGAIGYIPAGGDPGGAKRVTLK